MNRLLLLLGLVLLQVSPELTGHSRIPTERQHVMDEAEVDSLMPTTGALVPVWVEALEGVPAAAADREAFLKGFRGRFREREAPGERLARRDGTWRPDAKLALPLRLADEPEERNAWTARVRLDWQAPRDSAADSTARAWPGLAARVTVTALAPEDASPRAAAARTLALHAPRVEWLRFPAGHPVDAPYHQLVGRQVAAVVMEAVQRARGELGEDRRVRLERTTRLAPPEAAARPAPPAR